MSATRRATRSSIVRTSSGVERALPFAIVALVWRSDSSSEAACAATAPFSFSAIVWKTGFSMSITLRSIACESSGM